MKSTVRSRLPSCTGSLFTRQKTNETHGKERTENTTPEATKPSEQNSIRK